MANVHGFNDINRNQGGQRAGNQGAAERLLGGVGGQDPVLDEELRNNRVPFMNTLKSDRPPLD